MGNIAREGKEDKFETALFAQRIHVDRDTNTVSRD